MLSSINCSHIPHWMENAVGEDVAQSSTSPTAGSQFPYPPALAERWVLTIGQLNGILSHHLAMLCFFFSLPELWRCMHRPLQVADGC